ncbi:MAG: hypothetical protein ACTHU0_28810 [Kofleriaceae bacterium]
MKFYGRLSPGITTDIDTPLELVLHLPHKANGIVVKLWEKATYVDINGKVVKEDGGDDLLIELHGSIDREPALRKRGRAKFVVENVVQPTRDAKVNLSTVKVRIEGDETLYEATVPSTEAEFHGQNFEISITIEHGGSEVFRSTVPTFIRPGLATPRVLGKRVLEYKGYSEEPEWDDEDEALFAGHYATLGTASSETDDGNLVVTGFAMIDESGRLLPCGGDGKPIPGELVVLRTHKDLFAYITPELPRAAKSVGDSSISLRLCHPIEPDGSIEVSVPHTNHLFGFSVTHATSK